MWKYFNIHVRKLSEVAKSLPNSLEIPSIHDFHGDLPGMCWQGSNTIYFGGYPSVALKEKNVHQNSSRSGIREARAILSTRRSLGTTLAWFLRYGV